MAWQLGAESELHRISEFNSYVEDTEIQVRVNHNTNSDTCLTLLRCEAKLLCDFIPFHSTRYVV